ncbi:hypothetical protein GCM10007285_19660 [Stappia taiwanensis]|nr:hypothetical protein GCM10007285_19660 [Stappia taiwanensis]
MAKMDQRIRPPLPIPRRPPHGLESHAPIEADRLKVLLVHIGRKVRFALQRLRDELTADAPTAMVGVNEQGLHVAAVEQHEAHRPIVTINGKVQRRIRQEATHLAFNVPSILRGQKAVCGIDGAAPDFDNARPVGRA